MDSSLRHNALIRMLLLGLVLSLASVVMPVNAQAQEDPPVTEPQQDEPPVDEPVVVEPPVVEPVVVEPPVDEPIVDEPVVDEPVVDEPAVVEPPVDEPVVVEPPVDEPPVPTDDGAKNDDEAVDEANFAGLGERNGVFAPGTDQGYVDQVLDGFKGLGQATAQALGDDTDAARFLPHRHWDPAATALNRGGRNQGDSLELTWSIIPDGTLMPSQDAADTTCNSNLIATFDSIYGAGNWQREIQRVWDDWTDKTGNVYTPAVGRDASLTPIDDGARWPTSPGALGVRGDIRIGGCTIDGDSRILAYNFYPGTSGAGDMKIDATDYFYEQTKYGPAMHNVFSHEHGHGIGLAHVCPINETKLMEPFVTTSFVGLQHDDLRGIQRGYGDRFEAIGNPNDSQSAATSLSPFGRQTERELSLDSTNDEDWFQFTGAADSLLNVLVTPVGETYLEGATVNGSCNGVDGNLINTMSFIDLTLEIRNSSGVLATVNSNPAGIAERLSHFTLPANGTYYVRITGRGLDATQLYDLTVELNHAAADSSCPSVMDIGLINSGLLARDEATGTGYVMWSAEDVHDRFVTTSNYLSADHLAVVSYDGGWFYHDNDELLPFLQRPNDCLVAVLDFGADTAATLEDTSQIINGIDSGYRNGDLTVVANQWDGGFNDGEFDATGTQIGDIDDIPVPDSVCPSVMTIGATNSGMLARDEATGAGYVMWSAEDVHDRFVYSANWSSADHLTVVTYNDGWFYHNNDVLVPFQQAASDCLVAALDFDANTAVLLEDTSQVINGIDSGYRNGDLQVFTEQWDGAFNPGEFDAAGTRIGDFDDVPTVDSVCPSVMAIGAINSGMLARDTATGTGYVMWSAQDVHDRFVTSSSFPSADHLLVVSYDNGWFFHDNDVLVPFVHAADDCLVAAVDFDADTAVTLQNADVVVNGIDAGWAHGDLQVIANQWDGEFNDGEFDATGTQIGAPPADSVCPPVMGLGAINSGMLASDDATGKGYVMWSAEDLHERFVYSADFPTADHLTVVSYDDGWFYHDNDEVVSFVQAADDCLVAALDFDANTAVTLQGIRQVIDGIDSGYLNGNLEIFADQWEGAFNDGEFDATGTEIGDIDEANCTNPFADVEADLFFTDPVVWAVCSGITTGTHAGPPALFSPAGALTRGQMATLLWRYAGRPTPSDTPHGFSDVPDGQYYSVPIQWLAETGITTGTGDGSTFSPNAIVTRAQMATFLWRFQREPVAPSHGFEDVPDDVFFEDAVAWLSDTGITTGTGDGTTFSPNVTLTRAQAVTFLYRLVSLASV